MTGIDLIKNTLVLIKTLHEQASGQSQSIEEVNLAPKTLEQLEAAIAECDELPLPEPIDDYPWPNTTDPHEGAI